METRVLLPNRATDARWGYLDKFETNPQMGRAFAASMVIVLLAAIVAHRTIPSTVTLRPVSYGLTDPSHVLPPRRIEPAPRPHPATRPHVRPTGIRPVPAPIPDDTWDPAAVTGPQSTSAADAPADGIDAADGPFDASAPTTQPWPDPETFIPVEHEPVLVTIPSPEYPELAREAGIDGTVLVRVLVGEDGFVHHALILESVMGLDDAALQAARAAVFRPALQQERPVAVWIVVPIEFRLRG